MNKELLIGLCIFFSILHFLHVLFSEKPFSNCSLLLYSFEHEMLQKTVLFFFKVLLIFHTKDVQRHNHIFSYIDLII